MKRSLLVLSLVAIVAALWFFLSVQDESAEEPSAPEVVEAVPGVEVLPTELRSAGEVQINMNALLEQSSALAPELKLLANGQFLSPEDYDAMQQQQSTPLSSSAVQLKAPVMIADISKLSANTSLSTRTTLTELHTADTVSVDLKHLKIAAQK